MSLIIDAGDLAGTQRPEEIRAAAEAVARWMTPRVVVEVGAFMGASLRVWAQIATADAKLIAIEPAADRVSPFAQGTQQEYVIASRTDEADKPLRAALGEDAVDFLFIDGDHSRPQDDFLRLIPFVRRGGIVGMHDIVHTGEGFRTKQTWEALRQLCAYEEFIEVDEPTAMGIGLLYLP